MPMPTTPMDRASLVRPGIHRRDAGRYLGTGAFAMTTPTGTDVIAVLIRNLVEIDEEYERIAKPLDARRKRQREILRDTMIEAQTIEAIDEVSGYKALLTHQQADRYIAEKLVPLLRSEMIDVVIQTVVNNKAVQELVDGGMLTRRQLEREGALIREPKTRPFIKLIPLKGVRP